MRDSTAGRPFRTTAQGVSTGRAVGPLRQLTDQTDGTVNPGEIVYVVRAKPSDIAKLRVAAGILSPTGSTTSHLALIARELGIPCVLGVRLPDRWSSASMCRLDGQSGEVIIE